MKKYSIILLILVMTIASGCSTAGPKTKKGAGIGALTGAAIGGIVGHQGGHGWEGALIGGAAGAFGGGLIGNRMEDGEEESRESSADQLSVFQIGNMAKDGIPSSVIIDEIERTKSTYELTADMISYLKDSGVEDEVIDVMVDDI